MPYPERSLTDTLRAAETRVAELEEAAAGQAAKLVNAKRENADLHEQLHRLRVRNAELEALDKAWVEKSKNQLAFIDTIQRQQKQARGGRGVDEER